MVVTDFLSLPSLLLIYILIHTSLTSEAQPKHILQVLTLLQQNTEHVEKTPCTTTCMTQKMQDFGVNRKAQCKATHQMKEIKQIKYKSTHEFILSHASHTKLRTHIMPNNKTHLRKIAKCIYQLISIHIAK